MPRGLLDQHQDTNASAFGFGQNAAVRYRGQCFTPAIAGKLASIGFDRDAPATDIKVYIDTTSSNQPAHAVGSELYSWIIPAAAISGGYQVFDLPVPLPLTVRTQYCFYLAPFSGGVYTDDYHDCHGLNGGTVEITNNNGVWSNENLTFHYATYMLTGTILENYKQAKVLDGMSTGEKIR